MGVTLLYGSDNTGYCMALPSDLLASMAYPHVTNYRASDDYAGSSVTNFNLQTSSLLGWAVGLRPSKDVFFSTNNEPSNPYMRRLRPQHRTVCVHLTVHEHVLSPGPASAWASGPGCGLQLLSLPVCVSLTQYCHCSLRLSLDLRLV